MNRTISLLIRMVLLIFSSCMMLACQATPEKEAVVMKGGETELVSLATGNPPYRAGEVPAVFSLQLKDGKEQSVSVRDCASSGSTVFPVIRTTAADYSETFIRNLVACLMPDATLYPVGDTLTKGRIGELLEETARAKEACQDAELLAYYEERMEELIKAAETAPEMLPLVPVDFSLDILQETGGYTGLYVSETGMTGCHDRTLYVRNNAWDTAIRGAELVYTDNRTGWADGDIRDIAAIREQEAPPDGLSLTPKAARESVQALIRKLHLPYTICDILVAGVSDADGGPETMVYHVRCSRGTDALGGVFVSVPTSLGGGYGNGSWAYEQMHVYLNDDGILMLLLASPTEMGQVLTEKAGVLPWDTIQKRIGQAADEMYADGNPDRKIISLSITEAVFGLGRIVERDDTAHALYLPVWCIYGMVTSRDASGEETTENGLLTGAPLFMLNAIDGSIINPENCY